jgi:hypothetical protein
MKVRDLIIAAALAMPLLASAAEPVKFEVYLGGELKQSISLVGPHSKYKFSPEGVADTTLEFRLIAPEPLILEMKEITANDGAPEHIGRVTLIKPGSSVAVSDIKGAAFKHPYVLARPE